MRQVLLRLVQPGDVQAATRRRVLRRELDSLPLPASPGPMLERFARYRLLTLDRDPYSGEATVEIAHEVLIDEWRTLRDWLDAHHRALHTHRQLTRVAAEWQDSGRERSFLASGVRLGQFTDLAQHADLALNAVEHDFLTASVANHEHELRDARERHARLQASLVHREALRLAAESNRLRLSYGSAELVALLALRSIELCYTPQGDEALMGALLLDLPLRYLRGHTARIYTVAWGPDGRTVATAGQDAVIRLWDATTGSEMRQLIGHAGVVRLVAFSADGTVLASLGDDRTVRVWHVPTSAALHQLKLPPAGPEEIALDIAPDGRRLLVGGEYPEVLLWDLETGEQLGSLPTGGSCTHFVRFLPDGRSCVVVSSSRTLRWDVQTGQVELVLERPTLGRAALVMRDGALTLAGAVGARIELWDLATAAHVASGSGHSEVIEGMAADPSGARFATVSNDGTARIWDAATGREERRFAGHGNLVWAVAWSPDGTRLVTGGADGVACIWDTTGSQSDESLIQQTAPVHGVVYLPDGRSVITASGDRVLRLWDVAERREQRQFTGVAASQIHGSLACSPDGLLLASGSDDGTAYLWEIASARLVRTVQGHHGRIWGVAIARGNALLLTTGSDGTARLWDVASGALLATLQGHTDLVVGAAFTPDGRYAVTGSDDRTVRLWDVTDGREVQRLVDPNGPMMQVDAHPDGRHILTGSADGSVRLWDSQRGELVRSYVGHQGYIYSVICSADGRLALTCAADRTTRLWDIATGQELRRLAGHTSVVFDAALSRDGTQIITASYDRTARLWQADYRRAAALLSSRLLRDFTPDERRMYGLALE